MKTKGNFVQSTLIAIAAILLVTSCDSQDVFETISPTETVTNPTSVGDCVDVTTVASLEDRGACNQTLSYTPDVSITETGNQRIITSNSIPDHKVGLFGGGNGSLNPNAITPVYGTYSIPLNPSTATRSTVLLSTETGPQYQFGVLLNGVVIDPEAAEPWPHDGIFSASEKNWEWNLDAMSINLGLDCNNAHVQPTGKYHHHGAPTLYLESLNVSSNEMTLIGYAGDGFPIYYNYGYQDSDNANSAVKTLQSSYQLRAGERPGDGDSAPCGPFTGIYTNDYEYVEGLGDLDECNGRVGVTPEYPEGTYYYVITATYPFVPRCFTGTPSTDFRLR